MMEKVMRACNNAFEVGYWEGVVTVDATNKTISVDGSSVKGVNDYVFIADSLYNNGLFKPEDPASAYTDETFTGKVWLLAPPKDFIRLCDEISTWTEKNPAGGYVSESFGGYSYSRGAKSNGAAVSWEDVFSDAITPYRRMFSEVLH